MGVIDQGGANHGGDDTVAKEDPGGRTMEVEAEESKVGETQPTRDEGDKGRTSQAWARSDSGPLLVMEKTPSPTKTKTLEDDRRTDEVVWEWEEEWFERRELPEAEEENTNSVAEEEDLDETLERTTRRERLNGKKPTGRKTLKLNERLKEKARRQKDSHKKKRHKHTRIREEEDANEEVADDDEFEESDPELEADEAWWVGTKVGLGAESSTRAQKYLRSREKEHKQKDKKGTKNADNPRRIGKKKKGGKLSDNLCQ
ncbi:hypothetical protein PIB30_061503 [Stylosanthes scabra]|uniref:Uncharacterized protein n=1 Tax=Stylosanthes scabra TaxID=79078 RepID=A0ABU6SMC0_9FABA|nr:hypothetical protein [Stylosanthes scabra]